MVSISRNKNQDKFLYLGAKQDVVDMMAAMLSFPSLSTAASRASRSVTSSLPTRFSSMTTAS